MCLQQSPHRSPHTCPAFAAAILADECTFYSSYRVNRAKLGSSVPLVLTDEGSDNDHFYFNGLVHGTPFRGRELELVLQDKTPHAPNNRRFYITLSFFPSRKSLTAIVSYQYDFSLNGISTTTKEHILIKSQSSCSSNIQGKNVRGFTAHQVLPS